MERVSFEEDEKEKNMEFFYPELDFNFTLWLQQSCRSCRRRRRYRRPRRCRRRNF